MPVPGGLGGAGSLRAPALPPSPPSPPAAPPDSDSSPPADRAGAGAGVPAPPTTTASRSSRPGEKKRELASAQDAQGAPAKQDAQDKQDTPDKQDKQDKQNAPGPAQGTPEPASTPAKTLPACNSPGNDGKGNGDGESQGAGGGDALGSDENYGLKLHNRQDHQSQSSSRPRVEPNWPSRRSRDSSSNDKPMDDPADGWEVTNMEDFSLKTVGLGEDVEDVGSLSRAVPDSEQKALEAWLNSTPASSPPPSPRRQNLKYRISADSTRSDNSGVHAGRAAASERVKPSQMNIHHRSNPPNESAMTIHDAKRRKKSSANASARIQTEPYPVPSKNAKEKPPGLSKSSCPSKVTCVVRGRQRWVLAVAVLSVLVVGQISWRNSEASRLEAQRSMKTIPSSSPDLSPQSGFDVGSEVLNVTHDLSSTDAISSNLGPNESSVPFHGPETDTRTGGIELSNQNTENEQEADSSQDNELATPELDLNSPETIPQPVEDRRVIESEGAEQHVKNGEFDAGLDTPGAQSTAGGDSKESDEQTMAQPQRDYSTGNKNSPSHAGDASSYPQHNIGETREASSRTANGNDMKTNAMMQNDSGDSSTDGSVAIVGKSKSDSPTGEEEDENEVQKLQKALEVERAAHRKAKMQLEIQRMRQELQREKLEHQGTRRKIEEMSLGEPQVSEKSTTIDSKSLKNSTKTDSKSSKNIMSTKRKESRVEKSGNATPNPQTTVAQNSNNATASIQTQGEEPLPLGGMKRKDSSPLISKTGTGVRNATDAPAKKIDTVNATSNHSSNHAFMRNESQKLQDHAKLNDTVSQKDPAGNPVRNVSDSSASEISVSTKKQLGSNETVMNVNLHNSLNKTSVRKPRAFSSNEAPAEHIRNTTRTKARGAEDDDMQLQKIPISNGTVAKSDRYNFTQEVSTNSSTS